MPTTKAIAAGLIALTAFFATAPAQAHSDRTSAPRASLTIQLGNSVAPAHFRGNRGRWGLLSPHQVEFSLRRQGFHRIRIVEARGPVYRALAISPRGGRVALTVSARNGRILDVDRIGPRFRDRDHRGRGRHRGGRGRY